MENNLEILKSLQSEFPEDVILSKYLVTEFRFPRREGKLYNIRIWLDTNENYTATIVKTSEEYITGSDSKTIKEAVLKAIEYIKT